MFERDSAAGKWCILRANGPATLRLAASLQAAGINAWTPTEHIRRRVPRGKTMERRIVAVTPTYVFVQAKHLPDLLQIERADISPHPRFSVFRYYGDTVFVRHAALHPLRLIQQESYRTGLPASGRFPGKARGSHYEVGDLLKLRSGAFAGFEAFVETSDGLTTTLQVGIFGRQVPLKVSTLQLREEGVTHAPTAA
jgi:transcription antitermination factor NusG